MVQPALGGVGATRGSPQRLRDTESSLCLRVSVVNGTLWESASGTFSSALNRITAFSGTGPSVRAQAPRRRRSRTTHRLRSPLDRRRSRPVPEAPSGAAADAGIDAAFFGTDAPISRERCQGPTRPWGVLPGSMSERSGVDAAFSGIDAPFLRESCRTTMRPLVLFPASMSERSTIDAAFSTIVTPLLRERCRRWARPLVLFPPSLLLFPASLLLFPASMPIHFGNEGQVDRTRVIPFVGMDELPAQLHRR